MRDFEIIENIIASSNNILHNKLYNFTVESDKTLYIPFKIKSKQLNPYQYHYKNIYQIDIKSAILKSIIFLYILNNNKKIDYTIIQSLNELYQKYSKNEVVKQINIIAKKYDFNKHIEKIIRYLTTLIYDDLENVLKNIRLLKFNKDGFEIQVNNNSNIEQINNIFTQIDNYYNNLYYIFNKAMKKIGISDIELDDIYLRFTKFYKIDFYESVYILKNGIYIYVYDDFNSKIFNFLNNKYSNNLLDITDILKKTKIYYLNEDDLNYIENNLFKIKYINMYDYIDDSGDYNRELINFYISVMYYITYLKIIEKYKRDERYKSFLTEDKTKNNKYFSFYNLQSKQIDDIRDITIIFLDKISKIYTKIPLKNILVVGGEIC